MALTRKFLKALGIDEDKIDEIISAHGETVTALKDEIEKAKQGAEDSAAVAKERDSYKQRVETLEKASGNASKIQAEYDAYKAKIEAEQTNASKRALVKKALEGAGANPAAIDLLVGRVDLDKIEIENNVIKDVEGMLKPIKADYAALFGKPEGRGTPPIDPPGGDGTGGMSAVRQIAQKYHENLYGKEKEN